MKTYKRVSLAFTVIFICTGFLFLLFPDSVLYFFNSLSGYFGLPLSPAQGAGFYLILASAYMYLVALIACMMYRHPEQKIYPFLLVNGKLASSVISVCLFIFHKPYLIYIVNFAVDGLIGITAVYLLKKIKTKE
jgi:hypothetical protein